MASKSSSYDELKAGLSNNILHSGMYEDESSCAMVLRGGVEYGEGIVTAVQVEFNPVVGLRGGKNIAPVLIGVRAYLAGRSSKYTLELHSQGGPLFKLGRQDLDNGGIPFHKLDKFFRRNGLVYYDEARRAKLYLPITHPMNHMVSVLGKPPIR